MTANTDTTATATTTTHYPSYNMYLHKSTNNTISFIRLQLGQNYNRNCDKERDKDKGNQAHPPLTSIPNRQTFSS